MRPLESRYNPVRLSCSRGGVLRTQDQQRLSFDDPRVHTEDQRLELKKANNKKRLLVFSTNIQSKLELQTLFFKNSIFYLKGLEKRKKRNDTSFY